VTNPDTHRLRVLGIEFRTLDARRREVDAGADDTSLPDVYTRWTGCYTEILSLRATTWVSLKVKAAVLQALIETTESCGPVTEAAKSLAADIVARQRPW
jgi:hypothetical protein